MRTLAHAVSRCSPRRGAGLPLVLMITAFVAGVAIIAYRTTQDAVRTEDFRGDREFRDRVITAALTQGVELLATGVPAQSPYYFVVKTATPERTEKIFHTLVEIRKVSGNGNGNGNGQGKAWAYGHDDEYAVTARPGTAADAARWGPPPASFAPPSRKS
jgi:hypothetical protein